MSNNKSDSARKTVKRKRNLSAPTLHDESSTPKEAKLTKKDIQSTEKAPRRCVEREYTFHITQEELMTIPIYCPLSIKQEKYLNDEENDIIVWGGAAAAGKTNLTLLKILMGAYWDADFTGGIARRSQKQMKQAGSLWHTGNRMYEPMGVSSNKVEMSWSFPNGAEVRCHHLDGNQDDWQGSQLTKMCVDEAQQCTESDIWYLTSRLRSRSKLKSQLMLTCNPLNTSFLCTWLMKAGYVGEDGLAVKEMDGVTTFMIQQNGIFEWYKSRKEIESLYGKDTAKYALKFCYYSANVYDNPYIRRYAPDYVHKLENLKETERRRLLLGDWLAREQGVGYIKKEQFVPVEIGQVPLGLHRMRAWDIAGTKPTPSYPNPDFTRGVLGTYDKESGIFYIINVATIRENAAMVQALIETKAQEDGKETYVCIPIDPGAAGKASAEQKKARLMHLGYRCVMEKTNQSKAVRAEQFLIAVQEGRVRYVVGSLTDEDFNELEAFDGKKNNGFHDDLMDSIASCYNNLVSGNLVPTIRMNQSAKWLGIGGSTLLGTL